MEPHQMDPLIYLLCVIGIAVAAGFLGRSHATIESLQPLKSKLTLAAVAGVWASLLLGMFVVGPFQILFQVATIGFWAWTIGLRSKSIPPKP